jgi:hypothetical protein
MGRSRSHRVHDLRRDNGRLSEVRLVATTHTWKTKLVSHVQRRFEGRTGAAP